MDLDSLRAQLVRDRQLRLQVKVTPKSSQTALAGFLDDGTMKVRVAAVPEKGKANAELCTWLARTFGVPQRQVEIVSGDTSPLKRIVISL